MSFSNIRLIEADGATGRIAVTYVDNNGATQPADFSGLYSLLSLGSPSAQDTLQFKANVNGQDVTIIANGDAPAPGSPTPIASVWMSIQTMPAELSPPPEAGTAIDYSIYEVKDTNGNVVYQATGGGYATDAISGSGVTIDWGGTPDPVLSGVVQALDSPTLAASLVGEFQAELTAIENFTATLQQDNVDGDQAYGQAITDQIEIALGSMMETLAQMVVARVDIAQQVSKEQLEWEILKAARDRVDQMVGELKRTSNQKGAEIMQQAFARLGYVGVTISGVDPTSWPAGDQNGDVATSIPNGTGQDTVGSVNLNKLKRAFARYAALAGPADADAMGGSILTAFDAKKVEAEEAWRQDFKAEGDFVYDGHLYHVSMEAGSGLDSIDRLYAKDANGDALNIGSGTDSEGDKFQERGDALNDNQFLRLEGVLDSVANHKLAGRFGGESTPLFKGAVGDGVADGFLKDMLLKHDLMIATADDPANGVLAGDVIKDEN